MTESEVTAEKLFCELGFTVERIQEASDERPDYWVAMGDFKAVVEIKELAENDLERALRIEVESTGSAGVFNYRDDTKTLRHNIKKSNSQLKKLCNGKFPGLLVVQDVRPFWTRSLWLEESLKQAMFGTQIIWRSVPLYGTQAPSRTTSIQFGGGRTTTADRNRSISAIALMSTPSESSENWLSVYHNPFCSIPLNFPEGFASKRIKQFAITRTEEYGVFEKLP